MSRVSIQSISHPNYGFRVRFFDRGKRKFSYCKTKAEAERVVREKRTIEKRGPLLAQVTDQEAAVVLEARQKLEPFDRTLRDALNHYMGYLESLPDQSLVAEVAELMLDQRHEAGLDRHHLTDWASRIRRFCEAFGNRPMPSMTTEEISDWLIELGRDGLKAQTVTNYRRALHALFEFARKNEKVASNPVTDSFNPRVERSDIGILSVDQVKALMWEVSAFPDLVPGIALQLFGGMRLEEVRKMSWELVKLDDGFIDVPPKVGKGGRSRHIEITYSLRSFLEGAPTQSGPIIPSATRRRNQLREARRKAGITAWPHNCLRHSYASYHVALHESADRTALQLGHTNSQMLFQRYRAVVRKGDAEEFWAIRAQD